MTYKVTVSTKSNYQVKVTTPVSYKVVVSEKNSNN